MLGITVFYCTKLNLHNELDTIYEIFQQLSNFKPSHADIVPTVTMQK